MKCYPKLVNGKWYPTYEKDQKSEHIFKDYNGDSLYFLEYNSCFEWCNDRNKIFA